MKCPCKRRSAFTLVELLVVIGIIALLISILLPSLNKARQFANSIKCSSNERSIYQAMAIYASQNHGFFPPASAVLAGPGKSWANPGPNPGIGGNPDSSPHGENAPALFWYDILSVMLNPNNTMGRKLGTTGSGTGEYAQYTNLGNAQNMAYDVNPMFHDVDVPDLAWRPRVSSYMVNMRVIAPINCRDRNVNGGNPVGTDYTFHRIRTQGDIKRPSDVMMMWCGALFVGQGFNDVSKYDMSSWALDSFAYSNGHAYIYPQPPAIGGGTPAPTSIYERLIAIGTVNTGTSYGAPVTLTQLRADNSDNLVSGTGAAMRFRHLKNNSVNGLFVDGHVESRPLGSVIAKDICLNGK